MDMPKRLRTTMLGSEGFGLYADSDDKWQRIRLLGVIPDRALADELVRRWNGHEDMKEAIDTARHDALEQ